MGDTLDAMVMGIVVVSVGLLGWLGVSGVHYATLNSQFDTQAVAQEVGGNTCDGSSVLSFNDSSVVGRLREAGKYLEKHYEGKYQYDPSPREAREYLSEALQRLGPQTDVLEKEGGEVYSAIEELLQEVPDLKRAPVEEMAGFKERAYALADTAEQMCLDFYTRKEAQVGMQELRQAKHAFGTAATANIAYWAVITKGASEAAKHKQRHSR